MRKTVRCNVCEQSFIPPKESPFFPCPKCREGALILEHAEHFVKAQHTGEPLDNSKRSELGWRVVAHYSCLRDIVCEGSLEACESYMANPDQATALLAQGYHHWELVPPGNNDHHFKVEGAEPAGRLKFRKLTHPSTEAHIEPLAHYPARECTGKGIVSYTQEEVKQ